MTELKEVKKGLVKVLKLVSTCASAAGVFNPLLSVTASLIKVAEKAVDDESLKNLEHEFKQINNAMNAILDQNSQTLLNIKRREVDAQYTDIEEKLRSQFSSYTEIVKAKPEHLQSKKDDFMRKYKNTDDDQNINNLYQAVVGKPKVFSKPVLSVACYCSMDDKEVMKKLCMDLDYLFFIGCITMMTYYEFKNDHMKSREDDWEKKINEVKKAMEEWM